MSKESVTNKDLYDAINSLRQEISHRFEIVEAKVDKHDAWINQITGKLAVLMVVIGSAINFLWDSIFNKK